MPREADAKTRMVRKLRSKAGQAIFALRKTIVEPVKDLIKEDRSLGSFLLRGMEKVDPEWHLIAASNNMAELFRFMRSQQALLKGNETRSRANEL